MEMTKQERRSDELIEPSRQPGAKTVPLVWMPGPANGGEGTAGHDRWWDGEKLLLVVGPETYLVTVRADGDQLSFMGQGGDDDFGYSADHISWWAQLDGILPTNDQYQPSSE